MSSSRSRGTSWCGPSGPWGQVKACWIRPSEGRAGPAAQGQTPGPGREAGSAVPQEERILALVADGLTNGQIGQELGLAEKTVKNYVSSILAKLEVARRAEAAAYLARHTTLPGT